MNIFEQLANLQNSGRYKEALSLASGAKNVAKSDLDLYVLLSIESGCASTLKQLAVARTALDAMKELSIAKEPWAQFQIQVHEAQLLLDEGMIAEALSKITGLISQADNSQFGPELDFLLSEFDRTLGTILYKNELFEKAIPPLSKALTSDLPVESRSELLSMIGDCLALVGRFQEAIAYLSEAEQLGSPSNFKYRVHLDLGICNREIGDLRSAKTYLQIAKSLADTEESRNVAQSLLDGI